MKPKLTTQLLTLAVLASFVPQQMQAGPATVPTGGSFVAGKGSISTSGNAVTINQSTNRGIINWNNFSIGANGAVTFKNGSGATLNLVNGGAISSILGSLIATGSVYIMNPQGVVIGTTGRVNTGGDFVASSLKISNKAFMIGGPLTFAGSSNAVVKNLGNISSNGGSVFLIGHAIENSGSVNAPNGTVGLGAGQSVFLTDSTSDQRVFVQAIGGDVTNSGSIAGAEVELKAAGGNIYALAGNNGGQIRATGTATKNGEVWLVASGGTLNLAGTVSAQNVDGNGGAIETSGQHVSASNARVNTGKGGNWLLDPDDLNIDSSLATTIEGALVSANVTEQTFASGTGGVGDINVSSSIAWATPYSLTLSAYKDININNGVTISNTSSGNLNLRADNSSTGTGTVKFNGTGYQIDFSASTGSVSILSNPEGLAPEKYSNPTDWTSNVMTNNVNQLTSYMLVNNMTDLQNINTNPGGTYGLGKSLDETGVTFTYLGNPDGTGAFTGIFDGQGNTISNLTISSADYQVGLFGNNQGTIRNVGLMNDNVSGGGNIVGGLVGINQGTIFSSFVNGQINGNVVGGLVGENLGSINDAYSAGIVNGGVGNSAGLAYYNFGQINSSYSTAIAAYGLTRTGRGSTTSSYWDSDNSGTFISAAGARLNRLDLQLGIPTGFNSSIWGGGGTYAMYPYLLWQVPAGATAVPVSGNLYSNQSHTNLFANNGVQGMVNGASFGQTVYMGVDGYYYFTMNSANVPNGSGVITYARNGSGPVAAAFYDNVQGHAELPITLNYLTMANLNGSLTAAVGDMNTAGGALISSQNLPFSIAAGNILNLNPGTNLDLFGNQSTLLDQVLSPTSLVLETAGGFTQSAPINVTNLSLVRSGSFTLPNASNSISVLATGTRPIPPAPGVVGLPHPEGQISGGINIFSNANLSLGTTDAGTGIYTDGTATIVTSQGLTIDTNITVEANGYSSVPLIAIPNNRSNPGKTLVLVDGTTFTNNSGAAALDAPHGYWQVWSQNPANDLRGGELYAFKQYNATYGTTAAAQGGNGFLYTLAPTLSTTVASVSKQYDSTTSAAIDTTSYTPLTGAVDGDTVALTSLPASGSYDNKNAGANKTITVAGLTASTSALSGDAAVYGYTINPVVNVTSNITQAPLAVTTSAANKVYDGTTGVTGTASIGNGLFEGDVVTLAAGTFAFNDPNAGSSKPVTVSGLTLSGNDAGNYYTTPPESITASISPATLYYSPVAVSRSYGTNNPVFTGSITGFVGGDSIASATQGQLSFYSPATPTSGLGAYPILGTGITVPSGNYTLSQAVGNANALSIGQLMLSVGSDTHIAGQPNVFTFSYQGSGSLAISLASLLSNVHFQTNPANNTNPGIYQINASYQGADLSGLLLFNPGVLTVTSSALPPMPPVLYTPPPPLNATPLSILAGPNTTGMFQIGYSPAFDWTNFLTGMATHNNAFASSSSFLTTPTSETSSSDYAAGIRQ